MKFVCLQNCVDGVFDDIRNGVNVTKNSVLAEEMAHAVKLLFNHTEPQLGKHCINV